MNYKIKENNRRKSTRLSSINKAKLFKIDEFIEHLHNFE